eukprot:m.6510 g.6510  ORF g.6510 m.6510 type:complete len:328 (-) comp2105_c0_seq1:293-1276(-)
MPRSSAINLFSLALLTIAHVTAAGAPWDCSTTMGAVLDIALGGRLCSSLHREPQPGTDEPIHVIVAAPGRTGTSSLRSALAMLGYIPFHGGDLLGDPQLAWAYAEGRDDELFALLRQRGFNATLDTFMASLWREQLQRYPNARVVVAVRDSIDTWWDSWVALRQAMEPLLTWPAVPWHSAGVRFRAIMARAANGLFVGTADPMQCFGYPAPDALHTNIAILDTPHTRAACTRAIAQYYADVQAAVPPSQLLLFNVKHGFAPLCRFLGVLEATCPRQFPVANGKSEVEELRAVLQAVRGAMLAAIALGLAAGGWLLARACTQLKRKRE